MNKVNGVEIRGFEIVGPNNDITKSEAMEVFRNTNTYTSWINSSSFAMSTGGPLDMHILGLVKTRIRGKSHIENQKAVIPYVHDFALICEKKNHICSCLFTH